MKKNKLWFGLGLMFILATLLLSACSGDTSSDQTDSNDPAEESDGSNESTEATSGGTLNFAFNAQPPTLDPTGTTATATRDVARNIFEQLVSFDSNMEVQPMLAE